VLNKGLKKSIQDGFGMDVTVLPEPLFVSALGIALLAARENG
jgi:activator of 2-hydroxyglutaryl-CoA dehydratase